MSQHSSEMPSLGIIGFGAFGRLIALHLAPWFQIRAYDPVPRLPLPEYVSLVDLEAAACSSVVVLAVPVMALRDTVERIAPHLMPDALVLDVGSVKVQAAEVLRKGFPAGIDVVATHPLFGPQSAKNGLSGLRIAVNPIHGSRHVEVAYFLRQKLGLHVILCTPEEHDRELAMVQGVTHLIAKVLTRMEPLPSRMTTRSFERIMEAVDMVRDDAPEVFHAIEVANPYANEVRDQFFDVARSLDKELRALGRTG